MTVVLDASALLAVLNDEPGADVVEPLLADGVVSAVNFAEVFGVLRRRGIESGTVRILLGAMGLNVVPFDADLAERTGDLIEATRAQGLSLGDRACLALAASLDCEAVTSDLRWRTCELRTRIRFIR